MGNSVSKLWDNYFSEHLNDETPLVKVFAMKHAFYSAIKVVLNDQLTNIYVPTSDAESLQNIVQAKTDCDQFITNAKLIQADIAGKDNVLENNNKLLALTHVITDDEWELVLKHRKTKTDEERFTQCHRCNGERVVFSGLYGHPETSDGGPIMERCGICNGAGRVFK